MKKFIKTVFIGIEEYGITFEIEAGQHVIYQFSPFGNILVYGGRYEECDKWLEDRLINEVVSKF
jgi:hypothetical protein